MILSEGDVAVTVAQGSNPGATMTLLGVADAMNWGVPGGLVSVGSNATVTYQVLDAGGLQIIQPGDYDNGPVTITASPPGIVVIGTVSNTTPPAALGDQTFTAHCASAGSVTFTAAAGAAPNTAYPFGLTYSASNYSSGALGTSSSMNCVNS